jgi:acetylornithine deacetylase/succinyl-diaminopimelate desuccinylase-like protein
MTDYRNRALEFTSHNRQVFLNNLCEFLSIPSISTDPDRQQDMYKAAEWVKEYLIRLGFEKTCVIDTKKHPIVYAEHLKARPGAPTILIYGHYDVQPVDPLDLWKSDPFDPEVRGDHLYARGSSDMKGQVVAALSAVEAVMQQGSLPINIKFMIEGEEEIGSPSLGEFLKQNKSMLACDVVLNPDAGMVAPDVPTIVYALRGMTYFELKVSGPRQDLHSGLFGGVVHNPAIVLAELISGMHDKKGKITLPGFYDRVIELSPEEKSHLSKLPISERTYLEQTGVPALYGEAGYTDIERVGARPTLDVNGLFSGFTGKGSKTIIPAWAMAKISMRIVPDQDPAEVHHQLVQYLEMNAPKTIRWELIVMAGGPAAISNINLPATKALDKALEAAWGIKPVYKREGGSVPIVSEMQKILGVDSVLTGFGLPDDNVHSPNERLHIPTWHKGVDALVHFIYNLC